MKNIEFVSFLFVLSLSIISCQPDDNNPNPPTNPLSGKVKRMTYNGTTTSVSDFFYNSSGALDSIVNTVGSSGVKNTMVCNYYANKLVLKSLPIGSTATDSSIYYSSALKLDSLVVYRNIGSSNQIITYSYNGSGVLISYSDYLNGYGTSVPPTFTNYTDSNLTSTFYTYNTGPSPFRADSTYYTYSTNINNLKPSSFGLNFKGTASIAGYNITINKNLANQFIANSYIAFGPTIAKVTLQTDISYAFDSQNRVITETRSMTTIGSTAAPQITTYTFEYY
ncbi:MAG: hypothetical protein IPP60_00405 [Sphingobacteriales bacterium]|jgi:hypothetical protein|nr:hypothetical protein [Sphingobacteriales bacterium]MBP8249701.1 hypothetical protein [Chitinophagales bacterium]